MPKRVLILGGAKSGKSDHAQALAEAAGPERVYLATAQARDREMRRRIRRHQQRRGAGWRTVEEPLELAARLEELDGPGAVVLVDCLTLWLSNLLTLEGLEPPQIEQRGRELAATVAGLQGRFFLVANEVGWGIVPDNPLARSFRDLAGGLNQALARVCDRVVLVAAGLPLVLKGEPG